MHRHSTNAVIQFIQMENNYVLKLLLSGQSVGGGIYLCVPQPKCWGEVSPRPPIIAAPDLRVQSLHRVTPVIFAKKNCQRTTGEYTTQERCQTDAYVLVASVAKSEPSSAIFSLIFQLVLLHVLLALAQRTKSVRK